MPPTYGAFFDKWAENIKLPTSSIPFSYLQYRKIVPREKQKNAPFGLIEKTINPTHTPPKNSY